MKQKLRLGDSYALTKHKLKQQYIRYISLLAVLTTMCLYTRAQRPEPSGPVLSGIDTTSIRQDTIAIEEVKINTGYQRIPKERATGSFVFVDSALLNRTFSTDILSRLEGLVSGLHVDRKRFSNETNFIIRGPSTIQAENRPLIILDNFEYNGDINNINPNDIASITVLKDAAATSIWGAKAGNGVIVITSKTGRFNHPAKVTFHTAVNFRPKQDLYSVPRMTNADFIALETFLFNQGHYNTRLTSRSRTAVSPIVWALAQHDSGNLSASDLASIIDSVGNQDIRKDLDALFYRNGLDRQHALSVSGGGQTNSYYLSTGWDKNSSNNAGVSYERFTFNANNTIHLAKERLQINLNTVYTLTNSEDNGHQPTAVYPYSKLVNERGEALPVWRYNPGFIDTVGQGKLLDWHYRPLDELRFADNTGRQNDIKLNISSTYVPVDGWDLQLVYQFANGNTNTRNHFSPETYTTRDLINQFSTIAGNGEVIRPIPLGGILDLSTSRYLAHHVRAQSGFKKLFGSHDLSLLIGGEVNSTTTKNHSSRFYGYDEQQPTGRNIDFVNPFTSMVTGLRNIRIPNNIGFRHLTDRFLSMYVNGGYIYRGKYHLSASMRRDGSNLFGVRTNQKWTPLWSVGAKWNLTEEKIIESGWLHQLDLRMSYGKSGNIDRLVTAFLVARSSAANYFGEPSMSILNPPNPDLRWETVATWNTAVDFVLSNRRLSGSIEYFRKTATDLMGNAETPPSSGLGNFRGNTAALKGWGLDISLSGNASIGRVYWDGTLLYNVATNSVTQYALPAVNNESYLLSTYRVGRPIDAIHAYRWAGLSPENGDPRGYIGNEITEDYVAIINSKDYADLEYMGPSMAPQYGSLRNGLSWDGWSLSFLITFKWGHNYRMPAIKYTNVINGAYQAEAAQYADRWQQPGDEKRTHIPSFVYPNPTVRDNFYANSTVHIHNAAHIRFRDLRLGYEVKGLKIFLIAHDLGVLWQADKNSYDPEYGFVNNHRSFSGGLTYNFN